LLPGLISSHILNLKVVLELDLFTLTLSITPLSLFLSIHYKLTTEIFLSDTEAENPNKVSVVGNFSQISL
jgi:hypothetical protein